MSQGPQMPQNSQMPQGAESLQSAQRKIKVFLIEDDEDYVYLTKKRLGEDGGIEFIGSAGNAEDGLRGAVAAKPDIALVDLNLSGDALDGINAARQIRMSTDAKVILLTSIENPDVITDASVRALASAYVFKSEFRPLCPTIRDVMAGSNAAAHIIKALFLARLTQTERYVLDTMLGAEDELMSSPSTIRNQKSSIFKKLGVKNSVELRHMMDTW